MAIRLLAMIGAYIAASIVAGAILADAIVLMPGGEVGPIDLDFLHITALFVALVSTLVAMLAFLPAAAVSWYAERRGRRSPLFYAVAGAMIGLAALGIYVALLILDGSSAERFSSQDGTAGLVAL